MKTQQRVEFGDFQTPPRLALEACALLKRLGLSPSSVLEPTCGVGSFLAASEDTFQDCDLFRGYDINPDYVQTAQEAARKSEVFRKDFFQADWQEIIRPLSDPILILGNPPWVTNSGVGAIGGTNLPSKSNFQGLNGFDAITGKSNFDISEWMLIQLLKQISGRSAVLAMLCKTAVARKVLRHAWKTKMQIERSTTFGIDAMAEFGAAVDACLLVCQLEPGAHSTECAVFESLDASDPSSKIALRGNRLIADLDAHLSHGHLLGTSPIKWRSGIKHDCSRVMEIRPADKEDVYVNGFGETVLLEDDYLYPMLKGSELIKCASPARFMLVPQRSIGEDTSQVAAKAPLTWRYLQSHSDLLESRASSIYKNRPRFSVFGVGDYSFAPWKVAISGFHKQLRFFPVAPRGGKPVVLDDTCYFLPCDTESEARKLSSLLNSDQARAFLDAFVFWDAKRPITASLLSMLDLDLLALECGSSSASRQASLHLSRY